MSRLPFSLSRNGVAMAAAVTVCLVLLGVSRCQLREAQGRYAAAALRGDSLEAAHDTTRRLSLSRRDSLRLLGDSLAGVQRRAVQQGQRQDALDRALGLERVALSELRATVARLDARLASTGAVRDDSATGARSATFDVQEPPYRGTAAVELPPPPAAGTLRLALALDPIALTARMGCSPAGDDGIRPATVTVTGPPWARVELGRVEQDPGLCRSPALEGTRGRWVALRPYVGVGYGLLAPGGPGGVTTGWAASAGVGLVLWPP